MASDHSEQFVLLNRLADEFAERYRRGERPALKEYIDRYPDLADGIREFFPAMVEMEQVKEARDEVSEPPTVGPLPLLGRLGDYRIIREIGRGGMGVVYEADQVSLGRHVALKVLPRQLLLDGRAKLRFEREARAAAKLHHTNIVPVFGVGEHDGLPYYVMQFIQGLGLDAVLEELKRLRPGTKEESSVPPSTDGELRVSPREAATHQRSMQPIAADVARSLLTGRFGPADDAQATGVGPSEPGASEPNTGASAEGVPCSKSPIAGRLSDSFSLESSSLVLPEAGRKSRAGNKRNTYWHSIARIGVQVADALQHAHVQGVLHRDIKPSNLLLDNTGVVWVADFGLAKADDQKNLTNTGDILGTLRYMPPEAFEGRTDARSDVYSLGLTLYELLGLKPAFDEKDRNRLIKQVTLGEPARLDRLNPDVPRDLVTIVHKTIERDPGHRYSSASELMDDLQRFLDDEPIQARRQTEWERCRRWARRNPVIAVLGGILTAVLVLATVVSSLVAARMATLAKREARAANDADWARELEAGQRALAEAAQKSAQTSEANAKEALRKAEENFAKARTAVHDYLTAVSDDPALKTPGLSPLRAQLLQSALGFYQQFLRERDNDPALKKELAEVYYKVGTIFADLGQSHSADQSFARSRQLYEMLAALAPDDPVIQSGLGRALNRQHDAERAIAIWERLVHPDDPRYQAELADAYDEAAKRSSQADSAKELDFLRKSVLVRERLAQLRPDDPDARMTLASALKDIASRLSNRKSESLYLLQRAVEQGEAGLTKSRDCAVAGFIPILLRAP